MVLWKSLAVFFGTFLTLVQVSKSAIHKRDAGDLASIIESQIKSFAPEAFTLDVQFEQKIDRINKLSQYKLPTDEAHVYERNQDDSGKDVVVFTAEEDKIPFKKTKRAYVVLKKGQTTYFSKLALLRDATAQDKNAVSINGVNRVVEYTIYDDHVIPGRSPLTLAALTCTSSLLVPCLFNESALQPPEKFFTSPKYSQKQSPKNLVEEAEAIKFVTADGSDPDDNYDYYIDMEVNRVQGRILIGLLGGLGGVVPGLLGTVVNLLCSVLSLLSICPLSGLSGLLGKKRRKRSTSTDLEKIIDYPGYYTQFQKSHKDITFAHETDTFYGFGNCPYVQVKSEDFLKAQNPDEIIKFYTTILRADCVFSTALMIQSLVKDGLLSVSTPDNVFSLAVDHKIITGQDLSVKQLLNLNTAVELTAFSTVYAKQAGSPPPAKFTAPDGQKQVSRSTHLIVQVGLTYLKITREKVRGHILHLTRNLIINYFSIFTKLAQDNQNLESCSECVKDKEVNLNDRVLVVAFTRFIKWGLGPVERGAEVTATFETFYKQNEATILKLVNLYS